MIEIRTTKPDEFRTDAGTVAAALLYATADDDSWAKQAPVVGGQRLPLGLGWRRVRRPCQRRTGSRPSSPAVAAWRRRPSAVSGSCRPPAGSAWPRNSCASCSWRPPGGARCSRACGPARPSSTPASGSASPAWPPRSASGPAMAGPIGGVAAGARCASSSPARSSTSSPRCTTASPPGRGRSPVRCLLAPLLRGRR